MNFQNRSDKEIMKILIYSRDLDELKQSLSIKGCAIKNKEIEKLYYTNSSYNAGACSNTLSLQELEKVSGGVVINRSSMSKLSPVLRKFKVWGISLEEVCSSAKDIQTPKPIAEREPEITQGHIDATVAALKNKILPPEETNCTDEANKFYSEIAYFLCVLEKGINEKSLQQKFSDDDKFQVALESYFNGVHKDKITWDAKSSEVYQKLSKSDSDRLRLLNFGSKIGEGEFVRIDENGKYSVDWDKVFKAKATEHYEEMESFIERQQADEKFIEGIANIKKQMPAAYEKCIKELGSNTANIILSHVLSEYPELQLANLLSKNKCELKSVNKSMLAREESESESVNESMLAREESESEFNNGNVSMYIIWKYKIFASIRPLYFGEGKGKGKDKDKDKDKDIPDDLDLAFVCGFYGDSLSEQLLYTLKLQVDVFNESIETIGKSYEILISGENSGENLSKNSSENLSEEIKKSIPNKETYIYVFRRIIANYLVGCKGCKTSEDWKNLFEELWKDLHMSDIDIKSILTTAVINKTPEIDEKDNIEESCWENFKENAFPFIAMSFDVLFIGTAIVGAIIGILDLVVAGLVFSGGISLLVCGIVAFVLKKIRNTSFQQEATKASYDDFENAR